MFSKEAPQSPALVSSLESGDSSMTGLASTPSSVYIITSDGRTLKLPIPSSSPRDPLNWSPAKRCLAFTSLIIFTVVAMTQELGIGSILPDLAIEYQNDDIRPFTVPLLAGGGSLFTGLGAFVWVPLSLAIGRRPVFLLCNIFLIFGTIGGSLSRNYYQHLLATCCQAFALSIMPSLINLILIDMTYISQRVTYMAIYASVVGLVTNSFLAAIPHLVKANGSWRVFRWAGIGPAIFSFLFAFVFFPESYFRRPPVAFDGRVLIQSSEEKTNIYESWAEVNEEKALPDLPKSKLQLKLREMEVWNTTNGHTSWKAMGHCYPQIILAFFNPVILWVMVLKALILGCFISFGMTFPGLFTSKYNFPAENLGLIYLSAGVGALLSFPLAGPMMNRISLGLAVRNGGRQNPEHYLVGFIFPVLLTFTGQLLYGLAGELHWPIWVIFVSYAILSAGFVALFTATALWSTIAFPRWAAASMAAVSGGAYTLSIAFSFSIIPWIQKEGFAKANGELAALFLIVGLFGIPIAIWGKRFRGYVEGRWVSEAGALRPTAGDLGNYISAR